MNQIVELNAADFGLEETKAQQIASQFKPMLDKMVELEKEYNEVIKLPDDDPNRPKKAKEVRLKYVKVRTGTADIHKAQKAFYLSGGRYVDGWKNAQEFASIGKEEALEAIEKFAENEEKKRIASLQLDRENQLAEYGVVGVPNLGTMQDEVFENFLAGSKMKYEAKLEAERKAEEERLAKEQAEAEERERIRVENLRLKAEAEERERQLKAEREKVEAERKAAEDKAKKECEEIEAKARKEKAEAEAKLKAEREERDRILADIKAKEEAAAKAKEQERLKLEAEEKAKAEAERKAKAAPDKEKLFNLAKSIGLTQLPELTSDEGKKILSDVKIMLDKLSNFINEKTNQL
jgi:outer membrane translocation and assembly module TamA